MRRGLEKFTVLIDSNEYTVGNTWIFPNHRIKVTSLLKYGCDYSVRGLLGIIGIERKAYSDYVRCVGKGWEAFQKQLTKLKRNKYHVVIVEGNMDDPIHKKSSMIHDAVALRTAQIVANGIPVVFTGNRHLAVLVALSWIKEKIWQMRLE